MRQLCRSETARSAPQPQQSGTIYNSTISNNLCVFVLTLHTYVCPYFDYWLRTCPYFDLYVSSCLLFMYVLVSTACCVISLSSSQPELAGAAYMCPRAHSSHKQQTMSLFRLLVALYMCPHS